MKPLAHIMILASAGSGKTYALTNRFVELLARGAAPDRIVALTFTRKAAGEFFDEILRKLARAAQEEDAAAVLAREIGAPPLKSADFLRMLRSVADAMHRLRLGTLDSFFGRIARVFPLELGLDGEFEVLEEYTARVERQRVLRSMFTRVGHLDAQQKDFIESFKRATFGVDEKQLSPKLDDFLDSHLERYLEAPDAICWGDPTRIWPAGNEWLEVEPDVSAATRVLAAWIEKEELGEKQRARWRAFLEAVADWKPGVHVATPLSYVLLKAVAAWPALVSGQAVLEFDRKKQRLSVEACAGLADLARHVVGGELRRRIETTRGIHSVLRGYDLVYHDLVRRAGKLTFADVQRLLLPDGNAGALTRNADNRSKLYLDYRLDAEIDHWLLDEFQDTSFGQWSVLRNLIDEVIQDTGGTRSFFCVGDIKQAIFAWREGDPQLFREILQHYNSVASGAITSQHLVASWRSGPPVIEMVNRVFSDVATITRLFPGPAAATWNLEWRKHESAQPHRNGQSAVLLAEDEPDRWTRVVEILQEIRPVERGLTCAVLVQTNKVATELADFLRRHGNVPAVAESDLHVCTDNPVGAALVALVQAAAHPGDSLAWEHVQMTPLGAMLTEEGVVTQETATLRLLAQLHADGFERTMEFWLKKVEAHLDPADAFSRTRARQFAAAAARFDRTGSRDVAEFVEFMEHHVVRESESAAVVRVMTIHKSKGLGFDVVLLPDLEGKRIDQRRDGLAVQKAKDRTVEWILDLPPKLFYQADPVLAAHVRVAEADACYEALSLLYVAMTRAKRATYAIVEASADSTSRNYPKFLGETLGNDPCDVRIGALNSSGLWVRGDADWHLALPVPPAHARRVERKLETLAAIPTKWMVGREVRRPSGDRLQRIAAGQLFSLDAGEAAAFGAEVHSLLAEVEWGTAPAMAGAWRARGASDDAVAESIACLQATQLADLWVEPKAGEVWRERAFEIVLDNVWITGVFDRVIVERNARNGVEWVTVIDFKTDRVDDERAVTEAAARHASQLNLYRRVAAALTGVPVDAVTCELVFTRLQRRFRVPAA